MMNSWVYAGFDETYKRLGVDLIRSLRITDLPGGKIQGDGRT